MFKYHSDYATKLIKNEDWVNIFILKIYSRKSVQMLQFWLKLLFAIIHF